MANILIVDDDQDACQPLAMYLERAGHTAACLPDGREALSAVLTQLPDVVILDLSMPVMDGPFFLGVVRSYLRLQTLPIIVLTGFEDGPILDQVRHYKVHSIFTKSKATFDDILRAVDSAARAPQPAS